jgi:hypothetical protein
MMQYFVYGCPACGAYEHAPADEHEFRSALTNLRVCHHALDPALSDQIRSVVNEAGHSGR